MFKCARHGCLKIGVNRCSTCLKEPYCSGDCQKGDWKAHKLICKTLKKLSLQLQPYHEVARVIEEIGREIPMKIQLDIRVVEHLIQYAEHQYGDRIPERDYRKRQNGERIDNYTVEIEEIPPLYAILIKIYQKNELLSMRTRDSLCLPLYMKILDQINPWFRRIGSLNKDQINHLLYVLSQMECNVGMIYKDENKLSEAEPYCLRALSYARRYESTEEKKAQLLCKALKTFYDLRTLQERFDDGLIFAEELYNCVAIVYNPVHIEVQRAASTLIECLTLKEDFEKARIFAQMTLDSLKDPGNGLDQQSEEVARGHYDLAIVILKQKEEILTAEMLAREALRIRTQLYGNDAQYVGNCVGLLAQILCSQNKKDEETKELFARSVAITAKHCGRDGYNTAATNSNMGRFYCELAMEEPLGEIFFFF
jgi:tetratricopeptide (TPR) repeat protein